VDEGFRKNRIVNKQRNWDDNSNKSLLDLDFQPLQGKRGVPAPRFPFCETCRQFYRIVSSKTCGNVATVRKNPLGIPTPPARARHTLNRFAENLRP
jgi:hypothetical protein